jgi:hypothetical protein
MWAPVGAKGDRLRVGDQVRDRQRQRGLDHLRQPLGDILWGSETCRIMLWGTRRGGAL